MVLVFISSSTSVALGLKLSPPCASNEKMVVNSGRAACSRGAAQALHRTADRVGAMHAQHAMQHSPPQGCSSKAS